MDIRQIRIVEILFLFTVPVISKLSFYFFCILGFSMLPEFPLKLPATKILAGEMRMPSTTPASNRHIPIKVISVELQFPSLILSI